MIHKGTAIKDYVDHVKSSVPFSLDGLSYRGGLRERQRQRFRGAVCLMRAWRQQPRCCSRTRTA